MSPLSARQWAVFFLFGLLLFQLTGLSCLGEGSFFMVDNGDNIVVVAIGNDATDVDQDHCPCHMLFNLARPLYTDRAFLVGLAAAMQPDTFTPAPSHDLFRPPVLS